MAGAAVRAVRLEAPDYHFDVGALQDAVTPRTKLVLVNSPHNPTGKVFDVDRARCDRVALRRARPHRRHRRGLRAHGVRRRARAAGVAARAWPSGPLTISSAGKTFSFTGWKIGWACGPADLVAAVRTAKQFLTFVNGAPFQPAVAVGLGLGDGYFEELCDGLRAAPRPALRRARGRRLHRPPAGRHVLRHRGHPPAHRRGRRHVLPGAARSLRRGRGADVGVLRGPRTRPDHLIRFSFCKRPEVLAAAVQRLGAAPRRLSAVARARTRPGSHRRGPWPGRRRAPAASPPPGSTRSPRCTR